MRLMHNYYPCYKAGISMDQLQYPISALGLAFVPLGNEGLKINAIKFRFNMYTGPGYLSAFLGVIIILLLIFVFRESKLTNTRKKKEKMKKAVEYKDSSVQSSQRVKRGELHFIIRELLTGGCNNVQWEEQEHITCSWQTREISS